MLPLFYPLRLLEETRLKLIGIDTLSLFFTLTALSIHYSALTFGTLFLARVSLVTLRLTHYCWSHQLSVYNKSPGLSFMLPSRSGKLQPGIPMIEECLFCYDLPQRHR